MKDLTLYGVLLTRIVRFVLYYLTTGLSRRPRFRPPPPFLDWQLSKVVSQFCPAMRSLKQGSNGSQGTGTGSPSQALDTEAPPIPFDGPSPDIATALLKATHWNAVPAIYRHFIIRFGDDDNGKKEPLHFERAKQGIDFSEFGSLSSESGGETDCSQCILCRLLVSLLCLSVDNC